MTKNNNLCGLRRTLMGIMLIISALLNSCAPLDSSHKTDAGNSLASTENSPVQASPSPTPSLGVISTPIAGSSAWVIYRDPRFGYGLALPANWIISPTPLQGNYVTLTAYDPRFDPETTGENTLLENSSTKLEVIGIELLDPNLITREALLPRLDNVREQTVDWQETDFGGKPAAIITRAPKDDPSVTWRLIEFRLRPDLAILVSVYPNALLDSPTVQAILASIAFLPDEQVNVPNQPPIP